MEKFSEIVFFNLAMDTKYIFNVELIISKKKEEDN
jgi:hypothetical protein